MRRDATRRLNEPKCKIISATIKAAKQPRNNTYQREREKPLYIYIYIYIKYIVAVHVVAR